MGTVGSAAATLTVNAGAGRPTRLLPRVPAAFCQVAEWSRSCGHHREGGGLPCDHGLIRGLRMMEGAVVAVLLTRPEQPFNTNNANVQNSRSARCRNAAKILKIDDAAVRSPALLDSPSLGSLQRKKHGPQAYPSTVDFRSELVWAAVR